MYGVTSLRTWEGYSTKKRGKGKRKVCVKSCQVPSLIEWLQFEFSFFMPCETHTLWEMPFASLSLKIFSRKTQLLFLYWKGTAGCFLLVVLLAYACSFAFKRICIAAWTPPSQRTSARGFMHPLDHHSSHFPSELTFFKKNNPHNHTSISKRCCCMFSSCCPPPYACSFAFGRICIAAWTLPSQRTSARGFMHPPNRLSVRE